MVEVLDVDAHAFAALLGKSANYGIREMGWTALATPEVEKVGPKGYIHGWVFVGAPGVNALVHHPKYGHGKLTHVDEHGHAHVDFGGGEKHLFEHVAGHGDGHLTPRGKGADHITAGGAAARAGRHAEAAQHYRQAAAEAKHPKIAAEMSRRADAAQAQIPGFRSGGLPREAWGDSLQANRHHMQSPEGRGAVESAIGMHDQGFPSGPVAAHLRARAGEIRAGAGGDEALHGDANRLERLAGVVESHGDVFGAPRGSTPKPSTPPKPRAGRTAGAVSPSAPSKADEHAAVAEQALRAGDRAAAINHLMVAADAEPDKKRARALRDRQVELTAQDMGRPVPADVARRLSAAKPEPRAPRRPRADAGRVFGHVGDNPVDQAREDVGNAEGSLNGETIAAETDGALQGLRGAELDDFVRTHPRVQREQRRVREAQARLHNLTQSAPRSAAEVTAERDAAREARDNAKESKRHTQLALGARMRGNHDEANEHLTAAAALAPDEETRQRLLDARRGGGFDEPTKPVGPAAPEPAAALQDRRQAAHQRPGPTNDEVARREREMRDAHYRQTQDAARRARDAAARPNHVPVRVTVNTGANSDPSTWTATGFDGLPKPDKQAASAVTNYLRRPAFVNRRLRNPDQQLHEPSFDELMRRVPPDTAAEAKAVDKADRQIAALDRVMGQSKLTAPTTVYRGASAKDLGLPAGDATGHTWTDPGFVSTASNRDVAENSFGAGEGRVLLTVHAPAGTPALRIDGLGESETLLGRGQRFRVVADHGTTRHGARHLEVEIVPKDGGGPKADAPQVVGQADHVRAVRDAYDRAKTRSEWGDYVPLADLRDATPGLGTDQFDAAVRHMARTDRDVQLAPFDRPLFDGRQLTPRQQAASIPFGGGTANALHINPSDAGPGRATPAGRSSPADVGAALRRATSRAQARTHLASLTKPQLTRLARELGITVRSGGKDRLLDDLVEGSVGRRLDSAALSRVGQIR